MPIDPKIQAGFVRAYRGNSAEQQEAALTAFGIGTLYHAKAGETPQQAKKKLRRKGELLGVYGGLRALAEARQEVVNIVGEFHEAGFAVIDILTGERSDINGVPMLNKAWRAFNSEDRVPDLEKAAEWGALGGRAKRVNALANRMGIREALPIWRNPLYSKAEDALEHMPGWRKKTAYRDLGKRETPGGRRPVGYIRQQKLKALRGSDKGTVYFIRRVTGGPIKIGYAKDVESRRRDLQVGHHVELVIVNAIEGAHADEQALHKRFSAYRMKGEWFQYRGAFKRYFDALPSLDEP